jgi:hypothetical protein
LEDSFSNDVVVTLTEEELVKLIGAEEGNFNIDFSLCNCILDAKTFESEISEVFEVVSGRIENVDNTPGEAREGVDVEVRGV